LISSDRPWHQLNIETKNAVSLTGTEMIHSWINGVPDHIPGGYWKLYRDNGIEDFFNKDFIEMMDDLDLPIDMMVNFYRKPHYCHPTAHIDGSLTRKVVFGLNWVWNDHEDNSEMIWYEKPKIDIPVTTTEYGTAQVDIGTTDLKEIGRHTIGDQMTLVRVDVPHNIIMKDRARFVISIRCRIEEISSWQQALEFFDRHIVR
jgi:hypothetical protein